MESIVYGLKETRLSQTQLKEYLYSNGKSVWFYFEDAFRTGDFADQDCLNLTYYFAALRTIRQSILLVTSFTGTLCDMADIKIELINIYYFLRHDPIPFG